MGVAVSGSFRHIESFLDRMKNERYLDVLSQYGQLGVEALAAATPKDTGKTADSWSYEVEIGDDTAEIRWNNSNVQAGWFNVAVMLQLGHGTRTGGYVRGRDYINPAIQPIFDKLAEYAWREVTAP